MSDIAVLVAQKPEDEGIPVHIEAAQAVESVRASAIILGAAEVFLIGAGALVGVAFAASLLLKEIPLRLTRHVTPHATKAVVAATEPIQPALPQASA